MAHIIKKIGTERGPGTSISFDAELILQHADNSVQPFSLESSKSSELPALGKRLYGLFTETKTHHLSCIKTISKIRAVLLLISAN